MDRRIAEEALLAGAGYNHEEDQASLAASSGAGLAPGAAEGLASAPLQQSQQQQPQESASIGPGANDSQAASGFSWQGDEQRRMASQGGMGSGEASSSSSQESGEGTVEYAPQQSGAGDSAQEVYGSAESRGIAGNAAAEPSSEALQESGRWGAGEPAQNGEHRMPASQVEYVLKTSHAHQS